MIAYIYRQGFTDGMKASQDFLQMVMDNYNGNGENGHGEEEDKKKLS